MDNSIHLIIISIIIIWIASLSICIVLMKNSLTSLKRDNRILKKYIKTSSKLPEYEPSKYSTKEEVENIMWTCGYDYDANQNIFYSREDAWQKTYGYCRLYDESASSFSLIIDSEPIYFEYDNKYWLIEFWKGQYGMCSGGEVGVYYTEKESYRLKNIFDSAFYYAMDDDTDINIKFVLCKKGKKVLQREGKYWWITGFLLGDYAEPEQLSMCIELTLENEIMLRAFLKGLKSAGYSQNEFEVNGNTVKIEFKHPHTVQPYSRIEKMDNIHLLKNKLLCSHYNELLNSELNSFDNLVMLRETVPEMFEKIVKLAKSPKLISVYDVTKDI